MASLKDTTAPASGTATVTVACKFPNGVVLRVFRKEEFDAPTHGGVRTETRHVEIGSFAVAGPAVPVGQIPRGDIAGGYALTTGVPADLWAAWLEANKESDLVKNGIIFAHERKDFARGKATEMVGVRSGMEPITPDTDPRIPRPIMAGAGKIQTANNEAA